LKENGDVVEPGAVKENHSLPLLFSPPLYSSKDKYA
jgi:hypothetical protein